MVEKLTEFMVLFNQLTGTKVLAVLIRRVYFTGWLRPSRSMKPTHSGSPRLEVQTLVAFVKAIAGYGFTLEFWAEMG